MKRISTYLIIGLFMAMGLGKAQAQVVDVCAGNDTVELHLGNFHYGLVQWQVSDDNESWMDIDGAIDTVYRFLPERPRYYRAKVRFPNCAENDYLSQVSYVQIPPKAKAGIDFDIPAGAVYRLRGNALDASVGQWNVIEGTGFELQDPSDPNSGFIGEEGTYKLTWTLTNSCGSSTDTVTLNCVKVEYNSNLVVVDETDEILSDSTMLVNGDYVIRFTDPIPHIDTTSILIGYRDDSFLRRVVSVEKEGDVFYLKTEQGYLNDVIKSGAFCFNILPSDLGDKSSSVKYLDHYPTRKELADDPFLLRDGNIYVIRSVHDNEADKDEDLEITIEIEDGAIQLSADVDMGILDHELEGLRYEHTISLTPSFDHDIDFDASGHLSKFYMGFYDAEFEVTRRFHIDREMTSVGFKKSGKFNKRPKIVTGFFVGGVPVIVKLDWPYSLELSLALNGLEMTSTRTTTFTCAVEYNPVSDSFEEILEKSEPVETIEWGDLNGTLEMEFKAGPKLTFLVAGVLGPYVKVTGKIAPSLCVSTQPPFDISTRVRLGLDLTLGCKFQLFTEFFSAELSWDFHIIDHTESSPKSVLKKGGDNQVYSFGNYLPKPINVDVKGLFGMPMKLANVYFEPQNGGEVSQSIVSTDFDGVASTQWKPGLPHGHDRLKVRVYDCEGNPVDGTPLTFHAYSSATDPCIESTLAVEVYHFNGDSITPLVTGGVPPYMYSLDDESYSAQQPTIVTFPGNNYTFYVRDAIGCEAMTTCNVPTHDCTNTTLRLYANVVGNSINAVAMFGVPPYKFSIDGVNYQYSGNFTQLIDGDYTVYVRDLFGCEDTKQVTVNQPGHIYLEISNIEDNQGTAFAYPLDNETLHDKGVCWSTHHAPTVDDFTASYGPAVERFTFEISSFEPNVEYYVRAYAVDSSGTSYSREVIAQSQQGITEPYVIATKIEDVTLTSAVGTGSVFWDGGAEVTERGICWSLNPHPTINDFHASSGEGMGHFSVEITDLTPHATYYARAYAINRIGVAYAKEVDFVAQPGGNLHIPEGAINGLFTIGNEQQVYFSQGNLQYRATTNTWRFADHQYDYIGSDNDEASPTYDGWIDIFAWGTSGYNHGAVCYQPWCHNDIPSDYYAYGDASLDLGDQNGQADWGYNPISNGGNVANAWRTLTMEEWRCLLYFRNTPSGIHFAKGRVNNVNGVLLIPDSWRTNIYPLNNPDDNYGSFNDNVISATQWQTLEDAGVVFMPAAGGRSYYSVSSVGEFGFYWTSSHYLNDYATEVVFDDTYLGPTVAGSRHSPRFYGRTVRLVYTGNPTDSLPTVTTSEVTCITQNAAIGGGNILSDGGSEVTERGVCWSTSHYPSINGYHANSGSGTGIFTVNISDLSPSTTYYVRAYATNGVGTAYGDEVSFITSGQLPEVTTSEVTGITSSTATCGGEVVSDGGTPVTERGVCWSTNYNPTINDSHASVGAGTGSFTYTISGLEANTIYYVRAYATNAVGTAYGNDVSFITLGQLPEVTTSEVTGITSSTATCGGEVVSDGGTPVTERGVCWSTNYNPTINDSHASVGAGTGSFTYTISGLEANTIYYVRAYATNAVGTAYGNDVSFITSGGGDHDYVDLGLPSGLLWATCNVGANTPEEYGGYFAWGETQPKDYYDWSTYQYCMGDYNTLTKYCNDPYYGYNGFTDNLTILLPEDDAATANWGNGWRMPTKEEWQELLDNTTVTWTQQNGVNGRLFTASNGNSLFLPAAGYRYDSSLHLAGSYGYYWSSSLYTGSPDLAWFFLFGSDYYDVHGNYRDDGRSVRAVHSTSPSGQLPEVTTSEVTGITSSTATCGGEVVSDGGTPVTERGVCWSTNYNPTISESHASVGAGTGSFTYTISGLEPSTTYYVRAYATNAVGTAYGNDVSFITSGGGDHDYVDLGLPSGLLWATCNVGANTPEEYGGYFAWGETQPKDYYDWSTYQHCMGSENTLTKYCTNPDYGYNGFTDDLTILLPEDDAATANWGNDWRMPTKEEWQELLDNTTNTWTTQNGVNGRLFTAPNGNSLFLPAAGYRWDDEFINVDSYGDYWSSSLLTIYAPSNAWYFGFYSDYYGMYYGTLYRDNGRSVRAVRSSSPSGQLPEVTTSEVTGITSSTATCGGEVVSDGGTPVTERGVCWSTNYNPTISESHASVGAGTGSFTYTISGLEPSTTYYVRAYATNAVGTAYGNEVSFITSGGGDHDYVDLGLPSGLLWATCNVGANAPEEYGGYFAWGETQPKDYYDWSTYQYCMGDYNTLTKYCTDSDYGYNGFTDNLTILLPEDDAATTNWGNGWRMPTEEEWQELLDNTTHTWTTQNGVNGRLFTAPNGSSLFLPAAGYRWGGEFYHVGSRGDYWSSSLYTDYPNDAWLFYFDSEDDYVMFYGSRGGGRSVRAVRSTSPSSQLPEVTTSEVTGVTSSTAICGGEVVSDGGTPVTERGVCWSTNHNPTLNDSNNYAGMGMGNFKIGATGLIPSTTYYVRAYATNAVGTAYGDEVSFVTSVGGGGDHDYVDLGLPSGLLWATCNVGANAPEEYGDHFAWGETQPKDYYDWSNYQYCMGSENTLTKYCYNPNYGYNGFTDDLTILQNEDDAALVHWGNGWRMPKNEEWQELLNNTTHVMTTMNGVVGWLFTASNGNSVFLPTPRDQYYYDYWASYWSSSLYAERPEAGWDLLLTMDNCNCNLCDRLIDCFIRPVRSNSGPIGEVPEGAINGLFSVAPDYQVYFSQGNLQYQASTNTWKFAENQWDYVGEGNDNISPTYDGWIDLFGWGTSGYDHGAICYQPWSISENEGDYYAYGSESYNLYDQTGQADWGYNPISNGGNQEHQWRTLTRHEWVYVFDHRNTASGYRFVKASVGGINGVVLLPDDWQVSTFTLNNVNQKDASYNSNIISFSDWAVLEESGAVFMPASGARVDAMVQMLSTVGAYWSSSLDVANLPRALVFMDDEEDQGIYIETDTDAERPYGLGVRLVHEGQGTSPHGYVPWDLYNSQTHDVTAQSVYYAGFPANGSCPILETGACWSTSPWPTTADNHIEGNMDEFGYVNGIINGLTPNTTFYLRVFVSDSLQTYYSEDVVFTTFPEGGSTHDYVDLGLPSGTLWATCNIGAPAPEIYGDYFAWGETQPKNVYSWSSYQYCNGSYNTLTKYCYNPQFGYNGFTDSLTILEPEDDVATAKWGADWRMPTLEECQELLDNTTSTWTTQNGVNGWRFTAPNGNSLFLPAAGCRMDDELFGAGGIGKYWSNLLFTPYEYYGHPDAAWSVESWDSPYVTVGGRCYGYTVRPVRSNSAPIGEVPEGAINGLFSIAPGYQIYFSKGNLQYIGSANTPYWKFADHQWDFFGDNGQGSSSPDVDRDLFGWGTSGFDHGAVCYEPWSTSQYYADYYAYGSSTAHLYEQTGQADWGYNAIINGGNTINSWRTLSNTEWSFLLCTRNTSSGIRFAFGTVNGVEGVIILPDDWNASNYVLNNTNTVHDGCSYEDNVISFADWMNVFEVNGAAFLPSAGSREGWSVDTDIFGAYWSSRCWIYNGGSFTPISAEGVAFSPSDPPLGYAPPVMIDSGFGRFCGFSVRLVHEGQGSAPIGYSPWQVSYVFVSNITSESADFSGDVEWGSCPIIEKGACWSTSPHPTIADNYVEGSMAGPDLWGSIHGLSPNTTYYMRAFVTDSLLIYYSEDVVFTTLPNGGDHDYVDLGLPSGTLWATCNVGANTPEEFGGYFAWGETQPRDYYYIWDWSTYQYCMGSENTLTKYCNNPDYGYNGFTDDLTILLPEDDAATANWGNGWRMPTLEEWQELLNNTTNTWTTQNGVNGRLFTAPNGNSLFLPDAWRGLYWSSSLDTDAPYEAWYFYFWSDDYFIGRYGGYRYHCRSVRAVRSTSPSSQLPEVTTSEVTGITSSTATCGGEVVSDGGTAVTERGVCWSTNYNPTINDSHASVGAGTGSFTYTISGLEANTIYYVRAYATNAVGTAYGNDVSFITSGGGDHDYVDLGLPSGLLWATCNVGANAPEEYGGYFAWGETQPKDVYNWDTYQYCMGSSNTLTKYCTNPDYGYNGFTDDLTILLPEDDAATANWDNGWRMPTKEEWQELLYNTTVTWTQQNGVNGSLFTASNGTSLFLPAAGYRYDSSLYDAGSDGYYWSSSLLMDYPHNAWGFYFGSDIYDMGNGRRGSGPSVRAVRSTSPSGQLPEVTTSEVTGVTSSTATCGGEVVSDGGTAVTERGVCWSTNHNPTLNDNYGSAGAGTGSFTYTISGLEANTIYYVRAYATNAVGAAYGDEVSFVTSVGGGGDHDYVDLGLPSGLLWATCNVGANAPEEYGGYFAWGETQPKDVYNWSTYQYCMGDYNTLTKYCTNPDYGYNGFTDDLTILLPDDDAATVNWGNEWRMPTEEEWQELYQNTTSIWITQNGVNGRLFTAPNGNSLFLPAAGWRWDSGLYYFGANGYYWSSSLYTDGPNNAWGFGFYSGYYYVDGRSRGSGQSVRAVRSARQN